MKPKKSTFSDDWREYLNGYLSRPIIRFLELEFKSQGIKQPTIKDIQAIPWDRLENSWLSVPSCKELALFQQQIKI